MSLDQFECSSRENRLGSITGYSGTLKDIVGKSCGGCLKNQTRCFNTSGQCAHFDAVDQLSVVEGAV
ncbi:MAG: oxidoreductase, partial [Oscillospiraceae bacterium]|nr:oxidoreductase [Oscillospiraceae bacterium]